MANAKHLFNKHRSACVRQVNKRKITIAIAMKMHPRALHTAVGSDQQTTNAEQKNKIENDKWIVNNFGKIASMPTSIYRFDEIRSVFFFSVRPVTVFIER